MITLKLAYRNLIGAGLRTWLNVIVLSFAYVVIIWHKGILEGWNEEARRDTIEWEIGGGQYWQQNYDPYDPLSLEEGHAPLLPEMKGSIEEGLLTPILVLPASMYPQGRMQSVLLKGIDPQQKIIAIPSSALAAEDSEIPVVIGSRMARNNGLSVGDIFTVRWRNASGAFDAQEVKIVAIFRCNVATVDLGQLWLPLERLQQMAQMPEQVSLLVAHRDFRPTVSYSGWILEDQETLLKPITDVVAMKSVAGYVIFFILLLLAMLAIFDTQVLSIFRRRREIGTLMALGMTRGQVIRLFTLEGAIHALLATAVAALYGIPLLYWFAKKGMKMPEMVDDMGMAIAETIFPVYPLSLILSTILLVLVAVTIVSFLPTREIARMNPTEAIRGKVS